MTPTTTGFAATELLSRKKKTSLDWTDHSTLPVIVSAASFRDLVSAEIVEISGFSHNCGADSEVARFSAASTLATSAWQLRFSVGPTNSVPT